MRRGNFQEGTVDSAAVGATSAHDLMSYPPERSVPALTGLKKESSPAERVQASAPEAEEAAALRDKGFDFYDWGPGEARLVISWDQKAGDIEALAGAIRAL